MKELDAINEELDKDYQLVVLDYNMNNQFELLEKIKRKDKCEILVNACCIPNCPRRAEHYRTIASSRGLPYRTAGIQQIRKSPFRLALRVWGS